MPELPEVEVVRRGVAAHTTGAVIGEVEVFHPRAVRGQQEGAAGLSRFLDATGIHSVKRRGKFLWLELGPTGSGELQGAPDRALVVHLGMSGQLLIKDLEDQEDGGVEQPKHKHLRIRAHLSTPSGAKLLDFLDQRTFGWWRVSPLIPDPHGEYEFLPGIVSHIAPDPLEGAYDPVIVARELREKKTDVKRALLDQKLVSGIGNIYADEALWAARIAPGHRTRGMRQRDAVRVLEEAKQVMLRALDQGGTSFDSLYVNVDGDSGYFSRSLNAYGRQGQPCPRCGELILRVQWTNRSSHFCPQCQS